VGTAATGDGKPNVSRNQFQVAGLQLVFLWYSVNFSKPSAQLVSSPTLQVLSQSIGRPCQRSGGVKMDPQVPFLVKGESTSIPSLELSGSVDLYDLFHSFSEGPYGWRLGGWDAGMVYKLIINRGYSISSYLGRPKIEK
jgi:hypothetical protein